MIPRHLLGVLQSAASRFAVVTLTGPRQSGKTTLARAAFPTHRYVSLENPDRRAVALEDPRGFLAAAQKPVIFDEIQRAPDLFSYLQGIVDTDPTPGQYILTCSQNLLLLSSITQSLAGRAAVVHLMPLSHAELQRRPAFRLGKLFLPRDLLVPPAPGHWTEMAMTGFYPPIHDRGIPAQEWLAEYVSTYIERDVRQLLRVGDLEAFQRFVRLCAGRAGQLLDFTALGADTGIDRTTARSWVSVLEASFLVFRVPAYHQNFRKRLTRRSKLYFVDVGLLCYLLGIRSPAELRTHSARGAVFENLVVAELVKNQHHLRERPNLYFWRDSNRNEIDAIVDIEGGPVAIEIKSGETVALDWLKGLLTWRRMVGDPQARTLIIYGGNGDLPRQGVQVVSWHEL